jgi:hypothetical protein
MKEKIFILHFDHCWRQCCDEEYRLCIAESKEDAIKVAKAYRDKYFPTWSYSIVVPEWTSDNTAYLSSHYS